MVVTSYRPLEKRLSSYDFSTRDLQENRRIVEKWKDLKRRPLTSINWFVADFIDVYAGVLNIFRFMEYFQKIGVENRIIIQGENDRTRHIINTTLMGSFPSISSVKIFDGNPLGNIPYADVSIATYWTTAYSLLKFNDTLGKYYFIQDDERMFFQASPWSALVEETYRFGFPAIASARSLRDMYVKEFGHEAQSFCIAVDTSLFRPMTQAPRRIVERIFFYARPTRPRNGFDLGVLALAKIKESHPAIEIILAGADLSNCELPMETTNLGYVTVEETAQLYRTCDLGLYLMFTRHPGVIPIELMASGCIVVSNRSKHHNDLLADRYNCLTCVSTVSGIVHSLEEAIGNYELRKLLCENAIRTVRSISWQSQFRKIHDFIVGKDKRQDSGGHS